MDSFAAEDIDARLQELPGQLQARLWGILLFGAVLLTVLSIGYFRSNRMSQWIDWLMPVMVTGQLIHQLMIWHALKVETKVLSGLIRDATDRRLERDLSHALTLAEETT